MTLGRPRHLTLEEIGARAGVSRSTVSRVLNEHPDVRPEVRARVEAVIEETGYQPNPAARALVSNRSGLIGLVMLSTVDELFGDPYYSELVKGIQQGCIENSLTFTIFPSFSPDGQSDALTQQVVQRFVDGVIVTALPRSETFIAAMRERGKRMVVIGHPLESSGVTRVDVENRDGTAGAVAHLIELGRKRIAYVGPTAEHRFGRDREDGYRDALGAAGIASDDALIRRGAPTADGGYGAAAQLLAETDADAVFAAMDPMAEGVYRAAAEAGRRIPDDLAVVGFDGLPGMTRLDPVLTTVVQPVIDVGREAVRLMVGDDDAPRAIVLPTQLRIGGSCGAELNG